MDLYDPPYESRAADWFAHHASKYLGDMVDVQHAVEVPTICGNFKVGFVLACEGRRIGIELGGDRFIVEFRDEWRDALILGTGVVDPIYRLSGSKLRERTVDILYILSQLEPRFFSRRGIVNLERLVDPKVKEQRWQEKDGRFFDIYDRLGQEYVTSGIQRHSWEIVPMRHNCFREFYAYAQRYPGYKLDEIINLWMNQRQPPDDF